MSLLFLPESSNNGVVPLLASKILAAKILSLFLEPKMYMYVSVIFA